MPARAGRVVEGPIAFYDATRRKGRLIRILAGRLCYHTRNYFAADAAAETVAAHDEVTTGNW